MSEILPASDPQGPNWRPLNSIDRRVLGVLGEKAKTTPDAYPMSLNALVSGCNQKSNRSPVLQLEPDQVEESLDRLRGFKAVVLVEGAGRVQRYKHCLYEWLGVGKIELSVMIELLLRGPQTEGELRGRVSRMDPINDLNALRELLGSLRAKGLVLPLTPEGRGQVFTHALFPQRDLDQQRLEQSQQGSAAAVDGGPPDDAPSSAARRPVAAPAVNSPAQPAAHASDLDSLRQSVADLTSQMKQQAEEMERLREDLRRTEYEVQELKRALGV
jgi:uncharacterized protein